MRTIKHPIYLLALLVLSLFSSCTKYDFVETGKATSYHDTTMWEYFQTDSYNWSYLVYMTKRAGLEDLFQGTNTQYGPNITFLGITNHSIRRYLYRTYGINEDGTSPADAVDPSTLTDEETMKLIDRMSVATCRSIILDCVIPQEKLLLEDFPAGRKAADGSTIGTGGKTYTMASGKQLWIYSFRTAFNSVPGTGPEQLFLVSASTQVTSFVASHNIRTQTGIVHSLQYNFRPTDF